ncbi:MAG: polyprenyl synthetase family protein [Aigarchaeota archaeon]|nr:polyprenyl synthetase family protein [Aigarchaeota archaeon]MCX8193091.1 polyprenyl synthetase family protein [Nitrososphaeria archaeon]MDW7986940.1 polyprenyl synthetase family protein [Nitrososphaerota archaeon]
MVFQDLDALDKYVRELRREFDQYLYGKIKNSVDSDIIERVILGGKRLRPILLLMVFKALNGKDFRRALDVACALELAHNASLAHDDIIDVDFERRGRPTLWRQIGIGRAIIEGHRIINLAFHIALSEGVEIAKIFLNTWNRASNGALIELMNRDLPGKILYMKIIKEKTASLFEAAAECGALIAGAPNHVIQDFKSYGERVGIAFQLADDYVDIIRGIFSLRSHIVFYNRLEEKIRQLMISIKLKRPPPLKKILAPRINYRDFLIREISKNIIDAWKIVERIDVPEPHKTYLKKFPEYCTYSMLKEVG